jgi:hypothetical protein
MKTKVVLTRILFLSVCLLAGLFIVLTFGDQTFGPKDGQGGKGHQASEDRTKINRVDLGNGLELTETVESNNGETLSQFVKVTRNGETLVTWSSVKNLGQGMRTYYHNGKEVMSEVFGKDGAIEMIILVGPDRTPIEVFERKKDGTTLPVSSEQLEKLKDQVKLIDETFGPIAEAVRKRSDQQKMQKLVEDAVEKAQKASGPKTMPNENEKR